MTLPYKYKHYTLSRGHSYMYKSTSYRLCSICIRTVANFKVISLVCTHAYSYVLWKAHPWAHVYKMSSLGLTVSVMYNIYGTSGLYHLSGSLIVLFSFSAKLAPAAVSWYQFCCQDLQGYIRSWMRTISNSWRTIYLHPFPQNLTQI